MYRKRFLVGLIVCAFSALNVQFTKAALQILPETSLAPEGGAVHDPFQPTFTRGGASSLDLIQGKLPSASTGNFTQELSAGPIALTDGSADTLYPQGGTGGDAIDHAPYASGGNSAGTMLTYALGGVFNLQKVVVYGGWNDGGRDAQHYDVFTSSNGGSSFDLLGTFDGGTGSDGTVPAVHRVEFSDTLASNIASNITHVRFNFLSVENGYTGYSEIDIFGTQVFLPGDADRNGVVDLDDFYLISDNFLKTPSSAGLDGDIVPDNHVDVLDFRLWKNSASPEVLAQLQSFQIPEPTALVLLMGTLLSGGLSRRHRR